MNAGPGGFAHAPITKGIFCATAGTYLISHFAKASHRNLSPHMRALTQATTFKTPGELLFGCLLLYQFRIFERQAGSSKFGAYAVAVTGISYVAQLLVDRVLRWDAPAPPAPLPLLFASFVPFLLDVPALSHFSLLGWQLSDKAFVYLFGCQLLLSGGKRTVVMGLISFLTSTLYRANIFQLKCFRIPRPLVALVSKIFGPLLSDTRPGPLVILPGGSRAAAGAGLGAAAAGGGGSQQRPGAGAGPSEAAGSGAAESQGLVEPSAEALQNLLAMGFDPQQARMALAHTNNNLERAIALLIQ